MGSFCGDKGDNAAQSVLDTFDAVSFCDVFRDARKDYVVSGWIGLSLETVLLGVLFLVRAKKIVPLYFVFIVYSAFYIPAVVYWIIIWNLRLGDTFSSCLR